MALHFKLKFGMFLHQFGHAIDFDDGFRLQVGLARLEGDGVGHNLAVGGEAVVERHGTLGDTHIAQPRVAVERSAGEKEVSWSFHGRHIDHADAVHVALESPLVERESEMVPLASNYRVVF